jgi:toxin YoeB
MKIEKTESFVNDYSHYSQNARQIRKIKSLIIAIKLNPIGGIGKPERLKGSRYWSRHIDKKNRLIYSIKDDVVILIQCHGHYKDH